MTRRTLNQIELFKLMNLIEKEYAERKQTDNNFAAYANVALNLSGIHGKHVERARQSLKIPATLYARTGAAKAQNELVLEGLQNAEKRFVSLEEKVATLEKLLDAWQQLFPNLRVR